MREIEIGRETERERERARDGDSIQWKFELLTSKGKRRLITLTKLDIHKKIHQAFATCSGMVRTSINDIFVRLFLFLVNEPIKK